MDFRHLGFPPGVRFTATDEVLVEVYLLPRTRGLPLPIDGVILDDDPYAMAPWDLMSKHEKRDEGSFFRDAASKKLHPGPGGGNRKNRRVGEGASTWRGQKRTEHHLVTEDGEKIKWRKNKFSFTSAGDWRSQGWVMTEYEIVDDDPNCKSKQNHWILCRVKLSEQQKSQQKKRAWEEVAATDDHLGPPWKRAQCSSADVSAGLAVHVPDQSEASVDSTPLLLPSQEGSLLPDQDDDGIVQSLMESLYYFDNNGVHQWLVERQPVPV